MNTFIYFVRVDNELFCFYSKHDTIYQREYITGHWQDEVIVVAKVKQNFTICFSADNNKNFHLYYQSINGDVFSGVKSANEEWVFENLLKNNVGEMTFHGIIKDNKTSLVYNTAVKNHQNNNSLIHQTLNPNSTFSAPQIIDNLFGEFSAQYVNEEHFLMFYTKKQHDFQAGYREMTTSRISGFYPFYQGISPVVDFSPLTTNSEIHILYIVKNMFSCQLFYRKKDSSLFSTPVLLREARSIDASILYIRKDILHINYIQNNEVFEITSSDNGESFTQAVKLSANTNISKAYYIANSPQSNANFFLRHLFVETSKPANIISPNDLNDFYPADIVEISDNKDYKIHCEEVEKEDEIRHKKEENLEKFKKLIDNYEYQIHMKNKQVSNLNDSIEDKDYEISQLKKELETLKLTLAYYDENN